MLKPYLWTILFAPSLAVQDGGPNADRHKKGPAAALANLLCSYPQLIVDNGLKGPIRNSRKSFIRKATQ